MTLKTYLSRYANHVVSAQIGESQMPSVNESVAFAICDAVQDFLDGRISNEELIRKVRKAVQ